MLMTPSLRRFGLSVHIVSSVGLLGAIAVFLTLSVAGVLSKDLQTLHGIYRSMDLAVRWVVVPLALMSLAGGIVQSLATPWGLLRHYWVLTKFVLTVFATAILLAKVELIRHAALLAATPTGSLEALHQVGRELVVHAAGGLVVLLIPAVLSVYKPWGLTPLARRARSERTQPVPPQRSLGQGPSRTRKPDANTPTNGEIVMISIRRSVLIGIAVAVLVIHLGVLHLIGAGHFGH